MSIEAAMTALAALLLNKPATPHRATAKDELFQTLRGEGHTTTDLEVALFELKSAGVIDFQEHVNWSEPDRFGVLGIPDDVFLTPFDKPEPTEIRYHVVWPLPALRDWWKEQQAASPERLIEIPLGAPGGAEEPAKEQETPARRDHGKAEQAEESRSGTGSGAGDTNVQTSPPRLNPKQQQALNFVKEHGPKSAKEIANEVDAAYETVKRWFSKRGRLYAHGCRNDRDGEGYRYRPK